MRAFDRLLSSLLGLVLLVVGVLAAVEAMIIGLGHRPKWLPLHSWYHWLTTHRLDDTTVRVVLLCLAIAGLLLVVAESWPRRPVRLPIRLDGPGDASWWLLRRPAERRLDHDLDQVLDAPARVRLAGLAVDDSVTLRLRLRAPRPPKPPRVD
jgi:hypothetical protein